MNKTTVCGCGQKHFHAQGDRGQGFLPGHDGRLNGHLLKIVHGKMSASTIAKVTLAHRKDISFVQGDPEFKRLLDQTFQANHASRPKARMTASRA